MGNYFYNSRKPKGQRLTWWPLSFFLLQLPIPYEAYISRVFIVSLEFKLRIHPACLLQSWGQPPPPLCTSSPHPGSWPVQITDAHSSSEPEFPPFSTSGCPLCRRATLCLAGNDSALMQKGDEAEWDPESTKRHKSTNFKRHIRNQDSRE